MNRITSGDILHVEPLTQEVLDENGRVVDSFTKQYFLDKSNRLTLTIEETAESFKRRTTSSDAFRHGTVKVPSEFEAAAILFSVSTLKTHTLKMLKEVTSIHLGIPPQYFRFYVKDTWSARKLLKDPSKKLGVALATFDEKTATQMFLEILQAPEDLKKVIYLLLCFFFFASLFFFLALKI
jgi:hypothetical protein